MVSSPSSRPATSGSEQAIFAKDEHPPATHLTMPDGFECRNSLDINRICHELVFFWTDYADCFADVGFDAFENIRQAVDRDSWPLIAQLLFCAVAVEKIMEFVNRFPELESDPMAVSGRRNVAIDYDTGWRFDWTRDAQTQHPFGSAPIGQKRPPRKYMCPQTR